MRIAAEESGPQDYNFSSTICKVQVALNLSVVHASICRSARGADLVGSV